MYKALYKQHKMCSSLMILKEINTFKRLLKKLFVRYVAMFVQKIQSIFPSY